MARIDLIPKLVRREREKIRQTTNGWGRTREERDKIDGGQSFVPVIGWTRDKWTSFVPVGGSNRDKRCMSRLEPPTGIEGGPFFPVGVSNRDKRHMSPPLARLAVGPGTEKHLLSRAQRQPGQMAWNKGLFCSSDFYPFFIFFSFFF